MGRRGAPLLIAVAAAAAPTFGACVPDTPRDILIEGRITPEESAVILDAIHEANEKLGYDLEARPVLTYRGPYDDPDGFHFDDFDDGFPVIYAFDPGSAEYAWLRDRTESDYAGYATLSDVLLAIRLAPDATAGDRAWYRRVVLHELGHFLGLMHDPDPNSIMYAGPYRLPIDTYTEADQRAFCLVHGC